LRIKTFLDLLDRLYLLDRLDLVLAPPFSSRLRFLEEGEEGEEGERGEEGEEGERRGERN
jgi:hypothetical protein